MCPTGAGPSVLLVVGAPCFAVRISPSAGGGDAIAIEHDYETTVATKTLAILWEELHDHDETAQRRATPPVSAQVGGGRRTLSWAGNDRDDDRRLEQRLLWPQIR
jgi:hypothetical protein